MTTDNRTKINSLISQWPRSTVASVSYLKEQGFSQELLAWYKRSGWLESYGRGAYVLAGDKVEWTGALYALQKQLKMCVHAGGKTALELKGYGHFIPTRQKLFLYGERGSSLPLWFRKSMKPGDYRYVRTNLFSPGYAEGLTEFKSREFSITLSAPERASMEMLHLVPKDVGFEEASLITENLAGLRPELVQKLLGACRFVKVKRLFLYLAEKYSHPWFSRLDLSKLDLGKGKRLIVQHGMLDKRYQITVPRQERESTE
jgi:hypothetical protein